MPRPSIRRAAAAVLTLAAVLAMPGPAQAEAADHFLALEQLVQPAPRDVPVPELITDAAIAHHVSPSWMLSIAWCESRYDRHAVNRSSGAEGLYQLLPGGKLGTFYQWATRQPGITADVWDPAQQASFVADQLNAGQARAWVCA